MVATVSSGAAVAIAAVVACLAAIVGCAVARWLERRAMRSRLSETAFRLDLSADGLDLESLLGAIERSTRDARAGTADERGRAMRLQLAIDSMAEAVLVFDASGSLLEHNAAAAPYLDARHGDALVGVAIDELVRTALKGAPATETLELFGPPHRWVIITTSPVVTDGGYLVVAMVEDITERRLLEAVRTDFVANISHELKTPVGAIALLAETLELETDPTITERLAGRIHVEALRVGRTIEDLLELSRIESAASHSDGVVEIANVVIEAVTRLRPAAEQAGVEIIVSFGEDRPVVAGDRRQLQSAVTNLLDNSVKYSDPGSSVEIGLGVVDDTVRVHFTDHGIGIPARDLERIFERFYRVDQARSRTTGGTGLGLAIVRHIVVNHGGTIDVDSRLGEGSTFTLTLPTITPAPKDEAASHDHDAKLGVRRQG